MGKILYLFAITLALGATLSLFLQNTTPALAKENSPTQGVLSDFDVYSLTSTISLSPEDFFDGEYLLAKYYKRNLVKTREELVKVTCPATADYCYTNTKIQAGTEGDAGFSLSKTNLPNQTIELHIADGNAKDWMVSGYLKNKWLSFVSNMPTYPFDGNTIALTPGQSAQLEVKILASESSPIDPANIGWRNQLPPGIGFKPLSVSVAETDHAFFTQTWVVQIENKSFTASGSATIKATGGQIGQYPGGKLNIVGQ